MSIQKVLFSLLISLLFISPVPAQKLLRYSSIVDHHDVVGFENQSNVAFTKDPLGIITGDKGYHPVRICLYGILNYEAFIETGDSVYYERFMNQAQFFQNPDNYDLKFDGKGVALPYLFDYKSLKAPWYSGMAQGLAMSYLLRYSILNNDTSFYPLIRKIAYFQLQPESQGGTVSYSKTKGTWIEEYANATHARQVLNGSINAWIGLYEYCKFFPNDVAAARIRDEMYDTILHSLEIYCLPTWCRYNQSGQQCTPSYLRYHIYEMLHLYEIKGETKFLRQMMLWAMVLSPRKIDNKDHVFLRENHTIARPAPANASDWHVSKYDLVPELIKAGKSATSTNFGSKKELKNYILKKKSPAKVSASSKQNMFLMEFSGPINLDYITVDFESEKDIEPDFALFSVNSKTGEMKKLSFESNPLGYNSWHARILDKPTGNGFDNLLLVAKGSNVGSMQNTKVGLYNTDGFEMPWFGFYHTNPLSLTKDVKYCITVPKMHTGDVKIFWRYGPNEKQASAGTFLPNNYIQGNNFTPTKPGYYQFAIIFEVESVLSSVGMLIYEAH